MKKVRIIIASMLLSILEVSCSFQQKSVRPIAIINDSNTSPSAIPPTQSALTTSAPTNSITTFTTTSTIMPVSMVTKAQKVVMTTTPTTTPQCPELLPADSPPLLNSGNVIIRKPGNYLDINDHIWGFSSKSKKPYEVVQRNLDKDLYFILSPDGKKLAWLDFNKKPEKLIVHELSTGREQFFPYQDNWKNIVGWVDDQTVRINIETYSTPSKGIQNIYAVYDIQNRIVETETINLDLPNYSFWPPNPWWGFASIDSKEERVLYTACEKSNCYVILQNIQSGQEMWKSENGSKPYAPASWSKYSEKAAFSIMSLDGKVSRLVLISRDGKDVKVYTPLAKKDEIRDVGLSPDGQHVYFAEWRSADYGPGYVLDVNTGEIRNICTPGYFFGSGWWLPENNQLVYTVRKGDDILEPGIMELRILDLDSWTTQVLATGTNEETRFQFIGWTPIEFP